MTAGRRALGAHGERLAATWYETRGARVLDRNWRCREGEIDLIVAVEGSSGPVVVFCEVKTRSGTAFGTPAEAVTPAKQARIRRVAMRWLDQHPAHRGAIRFDVATVVAGRVTVLEAAF